ncbi:unnamed protein product [Vicia faba]|uniref:Uncharacterized protein n=1 Tax=Vicia faba TaxID=3906 RepID=A0AAV0YXE1_VICFA|nr:unnamed protein product [Vicia faba]
MKAKYPTEEKLLREFINLTNLSHFTEVYNRLMLIKESKKKAYNEAICSTYNKQLCIFVCCMINELSSGFLTPVITVLDAIESIRHLRERARCDPDVKLDIPFDFKEANAIKTMIGSCSTLCSHSIEFLLWHMNCQNSGIGFVCQYLGNELAWMDMHHLVLMNDYLVTSKSPVLRDLRVSREVEDLNRAITKVSSYRYPQFYMFMVSNLERFKIEPFVFPTLIAVAQVLEKGDYNVTNLESSSTKAANLSMVQSLVTLHQTAFPQNHSSPSSVQMQAVKEENRQKRSRTPMEQKNQILRASNVQMPPIIQEKTHLIILD